MGHIINPLGVRVGYGNIFWSNNISFFFKKENFKSISEFIFYVKIIIGRIFRLKRPVFINKGFSDIIIRRFIYNFVGQRLRIWFYLEDFHGSLHLLKPFFQKKLTDRKLKAMRETKKNKLWLRQGRIQQISTKTRESFNLFQKCLKYVIKDILSKIEGFRDFEENTLSRSRYRTFFDLKRFGLFILKYRLFAFSFFLKYLLINKYQKVNLVLQKIKLNAINTFIISKFFNLGSFVKDVYSISVKKTLGTKKKFNLKKIKFFFLSQFILFIWKMRISSLVYRYQIFIYLSFFFSRIFERLLNFFNFEHLVICLKKEVYIKKFFSAQGLLFKLGGYLENRGYSAKRVLYIARNFLLKQIFVDGFKICLSGRFSRKERATFIWNQTGELKLSKWDSIVDYANLSYVDKWGMCGLKVWLKYKT